MTNQRTRDTAIREFDRHRHLLAAVLDRALDVEAGLCEILLQSRHATLVDNLVEVVDIEGGLAAIVPREYSPLTQSWPDPVVSPPTPTTVDTEQDQRLLLERFVQSVDPQKRLALRHRTPVTSTLRDLALAGRITRELRHARRHTTNLLDDLVDAARVDPSDEQVRSQAREHHALRGIGGIHQKILSLAFHVLDQAWTTADTRNNTTRLIDAVSDALECSKRLLDPNAWPLPPVPTQMWSQADSTNLVHALTAAVTYAARLAQRSLTEARHEMGLVLGRFPLSLNERSLRALIHDFTTSDLRDLALTTDELTGVLWSKTGTRWPASIDIDTLEAHSQESPHQSGIFLVRSPSIPTATTGAGAPTRQPALPRAADHTPSAGTKRIGTCVDALRPRAIDVEAEPTRRV
ncbi:hypothetical protein [Embleya sp. NPDC059237]|uniref:hypothetical protein n=1 Tax=Embleya sp. NPDC059237 TaxID=3346784 RepID=UPI0036AA2E57